MVARVAFFDGQPNRFAEGHRFAYVIDAIRSLPGFQGVYHIRDAANNRAVSISFFEDEASARAAGDAVEEARLRGGFDAVPPSSVFIGEVQNAVRA